jgi:hypothetical protein
VTTPETILPTSGGGRPGRYKTKSGEVVPGVTTVVSRFKDSAALLHWSWQCGIDGKDYRKVRDEAASVGHLTHAMVEASIHGNKPPLPPPEMSGDDALRACQAFSAFEQWRGQVKLEIIATELPLVSEMWHFGGTTDCLALVNGTMTVLDWKASNAVYPDYVIQVAAYRQLAREHGYGADVAGLARFGKQYGDFTYHHWPTALLDVGWETFRYMLELYRLDKQLKAAIR